MLEQDTDYGGVRHQQKNKEPQRPAQTVIEWPDTDDIAALAKAATPKLFKKAVELAIASGDARLVRDVAVIAADRAHGKPHQSTTLTADTTINVICNIPFAPNSRALGSAKVIDG